MKFLTSPCLHILWGFVCTHNPKMCPSVSFAASHLLHNWFIHPSAFLKTMRVTNVFVLSRSASSYLDGFNSPGLYNHAFPILSRANHDTPYPCDVSYIHLSFSCLCDSILAFSTSSSVGGHFRPIEFAYFINLLSISLTDSLTISSFDFFIFIPLLMDANFTMFSSLGSLRPPWLLLVVTPRSGCRGARVVTSPELACRSRVRPRTEIEKPEYQIKERKPLFISKLAGYSVVCRWPPSGESQRRKNRRVGRIAESQSRKNR